MFTFQNILTLIIINVNIQLLIYLNNIFLESKHILSITIMILN